MSQIDPGQFANSYLRGASLGTEQFGMLANMAQNRASMQQRQAEFEADQQYRGQVLSLNIAEYERKVAEDIAQQQEAAMELDRKKLAARTYGDIIRRRFSRSRPTQPMDAVPDLAGVRAGQRDQAAAMDQAVAGMTRPKNPLDGVMQQAAGPKKPAARFDADKQPDPLDESFLDSLTMMEAVGDVEGVKALAKFADDEDERRRQVAWGDMTAQTLGPLVDKIVDPTKRAIARAAVMRAEFGDVMKILKDEESGKMASQSRERLIAALVGLNENLTPEKAAAFVDLKMLDEGAKFGKAEEKSGTSESARANSVAGVYDKLAVQASRVPSGAAVRPEQRATTARLLEASATARANPSAVLPDGSVLMDGGKVGRDGFIRVQRPDGREEGLSPEQFAAEAAPSMLQHAAPEGGGAPDLSQDFDTVLDRILAETPNATPEQVAAEMERRGFVME